MAERKKIGGSRTVRPEEVAENERVDFTVLRLARLVGRQMAREAFEPRRAASGRKSD